MILIWAFHLNFPENLCGENLLTGRIKIYSSSHAYLSNIGGVRKLETEFHACRTANK